MTVKVNKIIIWVYRTRSAYPTCSEERLLYFMMSRVKVVVNINVVLLSLLYRCCVLFDEVEMKVEPPSEVE